MTIRISPRALLVLALALAATIALLLLDGPAQGSPAAAAQAKARTFVSTKGLDTNTCGPADPCRTISRALVETSAGGEVVVLDSGGYGPFTIDKSVTVTAVGVYAGVSAITGNAININAGSTAKVTLRGLSLNGLGGANGIYATSVGQLYLDDLQVKNFTNIGIFVDLGVESGSLFISNTVASGNRVGFFPYSFGTVIAAVSNSRFEHNATAGVYAGLGSKVTVQDSVAADNEFGFLAWPGPLNVERSISVNNTYGLSGCGGGTLRASETLVTGNATGVFAGCGGFGNTVSFGNNRVHGNTTDGDFTSTVAQK